MPLSIIHPLTISELFSARYSYEKAMLSAIKAMNRPVRDKDK